MVNLHVISFGHSFGVPKNADLTFNLRQYPAPTRNLCQNYDGTSSKVQQDLLYRSEYQELLQNIGESVVNLLNESKCEDNESTITIAIGCEEGKHRSVAVVEHFVNNLPSNLMNLTLCINITHEHRDLNRRKKKIAKELKIKHQRDEKYNFETT